MFRGVGDDTVEEQAEEAGCGEDRPQDKDRNRQKVLR